MLKFIKFVEKNFPGMYKYLKCNKYCIGICDYIGLLTLVYREERSLLLFFIKTTFSYYILGNKKDVTFNFKGNLVTMPRHLKGLDGFIEVWTDKFYDNIKSYEHVLDIGGYIGDSAIRFAKNNKKVTVYEAHPDNFKYLKKNTNSYLNIISYNKAVIGDENTKAIKIYGNGFDMGAGIDCKGRENFITIPAISFNRILKKNYFDALKMDIEGAEYDCLKNIMKKENSKYFNFKIGFIEFHLINNKENHIREIEQFIGRLQSEQYELKYYDVLNRKYFTGLNKLESDVFLLCFKK